MLFQDLPIQKKVMRIILFISGVVLLVTCIAFLAYEYYAFKENSLQKLSTVGRVIATNSTGALAFSNQGDAKEILSALKAEPHVVAACLYDQNRKLFATYPDSATANTFPAGPSQRGYHFTYSYLDGFEPVIQGTHRLGTLYLKSDLTGIYSRLRLFGITALIVIIIVFLLAYLLSNILQKSISKPIIDMAETAKAISQRGDYSVRFTQMGKDELGLLTDAFNQLLAQIQYQNKTLSEFNQQLEQRIRERTNELLTVNKELESFTYSVSHDLRAPLRAVNGYAKILSKSYGDKIDPEATRVINNIMNGAKRMGQLIDDLLSFSRLGRKELIKTQVSVSDMVNSTWDELKAFENTRDISFVVKELPNIYADSVTLKQVWMNLISNALKYSRLKEKTNIEIGAEIKKDEIVYYIKDNGAGFDMRFADKLFGVFQRLHTDAEFEGTGVGLAIVHRIIDRHGGKIWAESKVNEGTQFFFSLPNKN